MHITLYIILGWCGLVFLPKMISDNMPLFVWILAGGLLYTIGIAPFAMKRKGAHFIWHFFVLFGALAHWFGIYFCLYNYSKKRYNDSIHKRKEHPASNTGKRKKRRETV